MFGSGSSKKRKHDIVERDDAFDFEEEWKELRDDFLDYKQRAEAKLEGANREIEKGNHQTIQLIYTVKRLKLDHAAELSRKDDEIRQLKADIEKSKTTTTQLLTALVPSIAIGEASLMNARAVESTRNTPAQVPTELPPVTVAILQLLRSSLFQSSPSSVPIKPSKSPTP